MHYNVLKSKLTGLTVNSSNIGYEGSLELDENLMKSANIHEFEKILVVNFMNGCRYETYAIKGDAGSGIVGVRGAGARYSCIGDEIIVMSFAQIDEKERNTYTPLIVSTDQNNKLLSENRNDSLESLITKPIFIIGCCNSGTTALWESLLSHPNVSGPKIEGQFLEGMPDSMKHNLGKSTFMLWAHPDFKCHYLLTEKDYDENDKEKIFEVYQKFLKPGTRFLTKSPPNTFRARLIQSYFPDAYFIAVVRDSYATVPSIVARRKYDERYPDYAGLFTTTDQAAKQWYNANVAIVSLKDYLKKYLIIKYEDMVQNPSETFEKILRFCELNSANFKLPSFETDKNQNRIKTLSDYDIETITKECGLMIEHFGYTRMAKELHWQRI